MNRQRIIIVGATSAIAEQCARLWAEKPVTMLLVGRDKDRLERVAQDLTVRSPDAEIACATADFLDPQSISEVVQGFASSGGIDIALVAHGLLPDQQACQADLVACGEAMEINAISPALFAEALAGAMGQSGGGRLVVLGSVAGDRGRRSNYVYGASKAMLDRYCQGLQHRFAGSALHICLVKPGPTRTSMTEQLQDSGMKFAPVEDVAAAIVRGVERGRAVIYAPGKWALIMLIIRHLPRFVFNRLDI